jgi:hypothetical protein
MNTKSIVFTVFVIVAVTFAVASTMDSFTGQIFAKKGEAALHISSQGLSHQSAQGAANSGVKNRPCDVSG